MHAIKYIPFILIGLGFIWTLRVIFKRDHLLQYILESFLGDNGKPDGKKISAFLFVATLIMGFFIATYYAEKHQPPEFYVYTIAMLVTSFYGIREVGRYIQTKFSGSVDAATNGAVNNPVQEDAQANITPPPAKKDAAEAGQNTNIKPEDIG